MRYAKIVGLVMALALLAGALPAQAQGGNSAVTDEGNNIYLVDGTRGPIQNLLPADEVAKIARLQSRTDNANQVLLSRISPDGTAVFVLRDGRGAFITLEDGTSVPWTVPGDLGGSLTNRFWLDANTLAVYALSTRTAQPTLFTWDRRTGEGRTMGALPLANQIPVFASADGRKLLLASVPPLDPANPGAALVTSASDDNAGRQPQTPEAPAGMRAHALLKFAKLFDPVGAGIAVVRTGSVLSVLDTVTGEIDATYGQMQAQFVSPDEAIIESQNRLDRRPYYYNLRSGEFRDLADRAGVYVAVRPSGPLREIVFVYSSFTDPPEIYRMGWDGTGLARLTWDNEALRQYSQTRQQPVSFTLRDGSTHSGVLILPADAPFPPRNLPIVVWQEGGPATAMSNDWLSLVESPFTLLPNFGFGVLVVPLYGRHGLGSERFEALYEGNNFGQIDIDAMHEIVGQLRARGWASRVGITGCSYGGYFVNQSITRHPTTYDAAHTMCSLVDLFTEWSRGFAALTPALQGLPPQAATEEYRRDSPAFNADRVRTPLLAFHGTKDFLPVTVMENYMLQVINNRVPARLLKFQGAGHGFLSVPLELSAAYGLYGAQEQIIWFRTYLMGR